MSPVPLRKKLMKKTIANLTLALIFCVFGNVGYSQTIVENAILDYLLACSLEHPGPVQAPSVVKNATYPLTMHATRGNYNDLLEQSFNANPVGYSGPTIHTLFDLHQGNTIVSSIYDHRIPGGDQPIEVFESPTGKTYKIWVTGKTWSQTVTPDDADANWIIIVASLKFKYARVGDMNGDLKVDNSDVPLFQAAYGGSGGTPLDGDFDFDNDVDFADYGAFWAAYNNDN